MPNIPNRSRNVEPQTFKTVQASASGNTAVWTPATGNKFRLLKYRVQVSGNADLGTAAILTVTFQDATTAMPIAIDIWVPAVAGTGPSLYDSGWVDLGKFGITSAAANNALNVNLSAALSVGDARIEVAGVEV